jgi:hypothetical protein
MYHNTCSYHNAYVFSCCLPPFVNLTPSCFFKHFPICCSHLWPPLCPPLLSTTSVLLWPKQSYPVGCYLGSHCLAFGLQTPYGWCQTILNIFFVKLLLCKPIWIAHQIYLILSSSVASDFFVSIKSNDVYSSLFWIKH